MKIIMKIRLPHLSIFFFLLLALIKKGFCSDRLHYYFLTEHAFHPSNLNYDMIIVRLQLELIYNTYRYNNIIIVYNKNLFTIHAIILLLIDERTNRRYSLSAAEVQNQRRHAHAFHPDTEYQ